MTRLADVTVTAGILVISACANFIPQYEGDYVDGKRHGYGTMVWPGPEAKIYQGEWVDGKEHGQGTYKWASGDSYKGGFVGGKKHGRGTYVWANGSYYEGDWVAGVQHGNGSAVWAESLNRYVGEWAEGQPHGHGKAIWANGIHYEGQWVRGRPHGHGTGIWMSTIISDGCCYQRDWVNETNEKLSAHSFPTEAWSMGGRYEGNFARGAREGRGTMVWSNGERYEGDWVKGLPQGRGVFLTASGDRYEGEFLNHSVTTDEGIYLSFYELDVVYPGFPSFQASKPCWKYKKWLEARENDYPINELPMFGQRNKTAKQKQADEELIKYMTKDGQSKAEAAESVARMGWNLYYIEDYSAAIKRFNQAWLLDPDNQLALWGFAVISFKRDQIEESIRYFQMAIESDPENRDLKHQAARVMKCWNNIPGDI